jgi:hypothetical protein
MRLTEAQQERYARHLLLDHLGGEGQERLLSSCVRIRGTGAAVRWAARYLAASGVGTLILEDEAAAAECRELSPDVRILDPIDRDPDLEPDDDIEPDLDLNPPSPPERGAAAALTALRRLVRP